MTSYITIILQCHLKNTKIAFVIHMETSIVKTLMQMEDFIQTGVL